MNPIGPLLVVGALVYGWWNGALAAEPGEEHRGKVRWLTALLVMAGIGIMGFGEFVDSTSSAAPSSTLTSAPTTTAPTPTTPTTSTSTSTPTTTTTSTPPTTTTTARRSTTTTATTTTPTTAAPVAYVSVTDLEALRVEGGCSPDSKEVSIGSLTFDRAMVWGRSCTGTEEVYYLIEGRYSTLTAIAGFSNASELESNATIEVWGDNERIAGPLPIVHGEAVPLEADVSGVIQLRFVVLGNDHGEIQAIGDPLLKP